MLKNVHVYCCISTIVQTRYQYVGQLFHHPNVGEGIAYRLMDHVAKWHNTTSTSLAFLSKWQGTRSYFVAFTKRLCFFGGGSTKFCFLEDGASRSRGGGCSVGDATLEPEGK